METSGAARLPSIHTCVGANEERLTLKWYKDHGNYLQTAFLLTLYIAVKTLGCSLAFM